MQKLKVRHQSLLVREQFHIFRTFSFHYRVVAISSLKYNHIFLLVPYSVVSTVTHNYVY